MMQREYIRLPKSGILPDSSIQKRNKNDAFWINLINRHLLKFYKEHNKTELKALIAAEKAKVNRKQIEDVIKDYMRHWFEKYNREIYLQGIVINYEPKVKYNNVGFYDLKFQHSDWIDSSKEQFKYYCWECKNLDNSQDLINKYVFYKMSSSKNDGGVYRYFNGKYAQQHNFGGMLGFILAGDSLEIQKKIIEKMATPFDTSPNGDLIEIKLKAIENNEFTFTSRHSRLKKDFTINHFLFNFM